MPTISDRPKSAARRKSRFSAGAGRTRYEAAREAAAKGADIMLKTVLMVVLGAILVVLMFKVFASPIKLLLKLGFNTLLGFAALYLFDLFGDFTGFTLGVNWLNAVVIAILGVPGFALLLILRWLFRM